MEEYLLLNRLIIALNLMHENECPMIELILHNKDNHDIKKIVSIICNEKCFKNIKLVDTSSVYWLGDEGDADSDWDFFLNMASKSELSETDLEDLSMWINGFNSQCQDLLRKIVTNKIHLNDNRYFYSIKKDHLLVQEFELGGLICKYKIYDDKIIYEYDGKSKIL